jgi:predicted ATPase/DNA-binding SARP family transcriptional activator
MEAEWRIRLFGGLRAESAERVVTRFETQKTGALLAYLAYHLRDSHSRELLADLLWPLGEPSATRHRLSKALSALRHDLAPAGARAGALFLADRLTVRLNPDAVTTDVAAFAADLQAAARAPDPAERARWLAGAVAEYRGPLLEGCDEEWVLPEREQLAERYLQALDELAELLEAAGERERALAYARLGASVDPLREQSCRRLMRIRASGGETGAALQHYRELERGLQRKFGTTPSTVTRALARELASTAKGNEGSVAARTAPPSPDPDPGVVGELPHPITRFVGREPEMARLRTLLLGSEGERGHRLVTLTGPGGSGKTRLAVELARRLSGAWNGAICFVPLADLEECGGAPAASLIGEAVGVALRLPPAPDAESLDRVVAALSGRPTLLVLDNFEHLVDEGALWVRRLLERVPSLICVVTSRQRLALAGEREFPVPPLRMPDEADTLADLDRCESVQFFVDRAHAVAPDFRLTPANASAVARLCHCLEGIPLALEIAAARVAGLTPAQILEDLGGASLEGAPASPLLLLKNRGRDVAARHRTLLATIDWSYRLLSPELQRFFGRLSVFHGGWTLEAADQVAAGRRSAVDHLDQLLGCSLVSAEELGQETRFRMLESLREFARQQLTAEEQAALARRHATYYLSLAERGEPELTGRDQGAWLERLEVEHDNLRAALAWTLACGEPETGWRLGGALAEFWARRGHLQEGRARLSELVATSGLTRTTARAKALVGAGMLACRQGDHAAGRALLEESLAIFQESDDKRMIASCLGEIEVAAHFQGDYMACRSLLLQCLAIQRELGDRVGCAWSQGRLAFSAHAHGEYGTARALCEEALGVARELGEQGCVVSALCGLACVARSQGEYHAARVRLEEGLAISRDLGDTWTVMYMLSGLANLALDQGDWGQAHSLSVESMALGQDLGDRQGLAQGHALLASAALGQGSIAQARLHCEASLSMARAIGSKPGSVLSLTNLGKLATARGEYGTAHSLLTEALTIQQALGSREGIAASLEAHAALTHAQEEAVRSARLLGAAAALRTALGAPVRPVDRADHDRRLAALRASLGEEAFAAAWERGMGMTWEQAVADAMAAPVGTL